MRKLIISVVAFFAIGLGTAQAQDAFGTTVALSPDYYGGISAGISGGSAAFFLHFGISDLITDGVGTRFSVGYHGGSMGLGADFIANLPVNTGNTPLGIYAGAGLGIGFHRNTNVSIGLLAGAQNRAPSFTLGGLFPEFGPAVSVTGHGTSFNLKGGFNYHF